MTAFGNKVYGLEIAIVEPKAINASIEGIRKKISREKNHRNRSVDPEFIKLKQVKIDRLIAIRKQLKIMKKVMMYQYVRN